MATLLEKLSADLQVARQGVADLELQVANLPAEIASIEESVWVQIKTFLGVV